MKKYLRVLALTLAAVFVFAACDSSGGDDGPREETASFESADGKTVLTLTYSTVVKNSPTRRAPAAGQSGTYTLEVDGEVKSRGSFQSTGITLEFRSEKDTQFTATLGGGDLAFTDGAIPLDDGEVLSISPITEKYDDDTLELPTVEAILGGASVGPGALGMTLTIEGEQVWMRNENEEHIEANDVSMTITNEGEGFSGGSRIGEITAGKFSAVLSEPPMLETFSQIHGNELEAFESTTFSDPEVKYFYLRRFPNSEYGHGGAVDWRGVNKEIRTMTGDENYWVEGRIIVRHIYVENDVTFSGKGGISYELDSGVPGLDKQTTVCMDFRIDLVKGWNAIFDVQINEITNSDSFMEMKRTTMIKSGDPDLKWVLEPESNY